MDPFVFKAGALDYQTFAKNLEVLETWITEAEETLKEQDPSHSSDVSAIQSRMEQLKVTNKHRECYGFSSVGLVIHSAGYAQISHMHSICGKGLSLMKRIRLRTWKFDGSQGMIVALSLSKDEKDSQTVQNKINNRSKWERKLQQFLEISFVLFSHNFFLNLFNSCLSGISFRYEVIHTFWVT